MKNYLIIGGSAVLGQGSIAAIRRHDKETNQKSYIMSTTSSDKDVEYVDQTFHNINLDEIQTVEKLTQSIDKKIDVLIYVPAKGLVGESYKNIQKNEIVDALKFSIDPCLVLFQKLKPKVTIGISAFVWPDIVSEVYGAMVYVKHIQDITAAKNPSSYKSVRFGFFESFSSRGVGIIVQKASRKADADTVLGKMYNGYRTEGRQKNMSFLQYFIESWTAEEKKYGSQFNTPYRITNKEDIVNAFYFTLFHSQKPIINVIGQWIWEDEKEHSMPELVEKVNLEFQDKYIEGFRA